MSRFVYRVGEGWIDGKEPRNNLCQFSRVAIDHHTMPTYDFIDCNVTGKPIRIHGKRQWRSLLKEHHLTDDVHWKDKFDWNRNPLTDEKRRTISESIDKAIKEVSTRPYARWGGLSQSEIRQDSARERSRIERMRSERS